MNSYLSNKIKVLSFISMVLIVYLHSYIPMDSENMVSYLQYFISQEISRIAVPTFFLISGILFFRDIYTYDNSIFITKIKHRIHSLLIPYLIFSILGFIFVYAVQQFISTQSYEQISNYSLLKIIYTLLINPIGCYQLWFVRDLFILSLLTPCIYYGLKKLKRWLILCLFILWITGIQYIITIDSIFFFTTGAYLGYYQMQYLKRTQNSKWIVSIFLFIWFTVDFLNTYYHIGNLFHCLGILIGIYSIWILYDTIYHKFEKYISSQIFSYSFFIYLTHEPLLTIIKKVLLAELGEYILSILFIYIIAPIMTIALCIMSGKVLKRKCKKIYSIITGGR